MKRLLLSVLTLGLVSLSAFAATRAYFSDQAAVLGNTISTGKINIDLRGHETQPFIISNLMPDVWTEPMKLEIYNNTDSYPVWYNIKSAFVSQTKSGLYNNINVRVRHTHAGTPSPIDWHIVFEGKLNTMDFPSSVSPVSQMLDVNTTHVYYFQFQLTPETGNPFQGKSAVFNLIVDANQQEDPRGF